MIKRKMLTTLFLIIIIALVGILGAKALINLNFWDGDDELAEVEETTQRLINIINDLDDDINYSNKNLANARNELASLQTRFEDQSNQLTQKIADYKTLQSDYSTLQSEKTSLQDQYDSLIIERDNLQTSYTEVVNQKSDLQSSYDQLSSDYEQLLNDYDDEQDSHDVTKSLLTQARTQLSNYETQISALTQEKTDLENQITSLNQTITTLTQTIATLEQEKLTLAQEKATLEQDIEDLNQDIADKNALIQTKQETIDSLESQISTLQTEKASLQTQLSEAKDNIEFLNGEVEKANQAALDHQLAVCTQLEQLPYIYRLDFKEQCDSISLYDVESVVGVGTQLLETYSEFRVADFSNSSSSSLYLGTDVDKNNQNTEVDYNNWQSENIVTFNYESSTGLMTLNINGETINQLEYTELSDVTLLDTINLTITETTNAGFETGEILISDISLNGEISTEVYSVKDGVTTINYHGYIGDTNNNVNLSFKLSIIGDMPDSDETKVDVVVGRS